MSMRNQRRMTRLARALRRPSVGAGVPTGVEGVLANIFRAIAIERNLNETSFGKLVNSFIARSDRRHDSKVKQNGHRGNLTKAAASDKLTLRSFCTLSQVIDVVEQEITIVSRFRDGQVITTSQNVQYAQVGDPGDLDDENLEDN